MSEHRFRFAPSPTGFLHIGGARTALYNWLLARQSPQNVLVLRLEDTDRERSTDEAVAQILDAMEWLGLDWDEGPFRQTERSDLYAERLEQLFQSGAAYWDTAGAAEVKAAKEASAEPATAAPGGGGNRGCGRALARARRGHTVVRDVIRGESAFEHRLLDDFVIARADRTPLYNFAVAVDDTDMGITHVVRGEDHLSNTPRQLLVLEALGAEPPLYAHLPLLHGTDGKPLSKRHGAASVQELRDDRIPPRGGPQLPRAAGLGIRRRDHLLHDRGPDREVLAGARVALTRGLRRAEALWMNGQYIREMDTSRADAPGRGVDDASVTCREQMTRASRRRSRRSRTRSRPWRRSRASWASPSGRSRPTPRPGTR